MEDIVVSVVIVTYNHEQFIRQALESVLTQKVTYKMEVLVGDDCSSDHTPEIVAEYGERYPEVVYPFLRETNLGARKNMIDLCEKCRGRYIAFLDGDDFWIDENKLQRQIDFLETHAEYVSVYTGRIIVNGNGQRDEQWEQWIPSFEGGEFTIREYEKYLLPGQTSSACHRAKQVREIMGLSKHHMKIRFSPGDRLLPLMELAQGRIYCFKDHMVAYRYILQSGSGTWSSQNDIFTYKNFYVYIMQLKELEEIAHEVKLELDFDERRKYEFSKISEKRNRDTNRLRVLVFRHINHKWDFIRFLIQRKREYRKQGMKNEMK